jgi:Kef-type K+ transport system membrane component KefB
MSMILKITIVLLFGFIFGKIAKKYGLPSVSGYLIGGLFLGPSLFGMLDASELDGLIFISEIALAVIAFSIGSEFLFSDLKKVGKAVLIITLLEAITAVFLVFFVMFVLFNQPLALSLVVAAMSASTAPAATMLVIRQYRAKRSFNKNHFTSSCT